MQDARALILIVDDDASIRRALSRLFQYAGLEVEVYASAGELFGRELPDRPACLLLDLHMPEVHGFEVLERVAATLPELPVVIVTADSRAETEARAHRLGAAGFLRKPLDEEDLLGTIRRVLGAAA
ncbi:MAG TPA: response regulator [Thermoanaerobaculia bacterium]